MPETVDPISPQVFNSPLDAKKDTEDSAINGKIPPTAKNKIEKRLTRPPSSGQGDTPFDPTKLAVIGGEPGDPPVSTGSQDNIPTGRPRSKSLPSPPRPPGGDPVLGRSKSQSDLIALKEMEQSGTRVVVQKGGQDIVSSSTADAAPASDPGNCNCTKHDDINTCA
jgi:hypothetical protein